MFPGFFNRTLKKKYILDLSVHKKFSGSKLLSMIFNRISPVISFYRSLPMLNAQQQGDRAILDTHDSLTDWHKKFGSKQEIRKTLENLAATGIWCQLGGNGVEARCKKPFK